jgi:gas vesicle protein
VREIVGFVMGAAAGAAGALFATSTEGRALVERLRDEARPEVDRAATEWEPVLREVGRAVRLAAKEVEAATADLRSRIGEIAAAVPADAEADASTDAPADASAEAGVPAGSDPSAEAVAFAAAEAVPTDVTAPEVTATAPAVGDLVVDDHAPGA